MKPISQAIYGYRDMETQILAQKEVLTNRQSAAEQAGDETEVLRVQAALDATENSLTQIHSENGAENSMSRYQIWKRDISKAIEKPFLGWGPGYNSSTGTSSSLNVYIAVFLESGIVGAGSLGLFLLFVGIHIARSTFPSKYVFLFAYAAGLIHMTTQTRFFFPFVWLLLALFWLENKRHATELE
jgi:O-antigen ligase